MTSSISLERIQSPPVPFAARSLAALMMSKPDQKKNRVGGITRHAYERERGRQRHDARERETRNGFREVDIVSYWIDEWMGRIRIQSVYTHARVTLHSLTN